MRNSPRHSLGFASAGDCFAVALLAARAAVAVLELLAAATGARVVAARFGEGLFAGHILLVEDTHHVGQRAAVAELVDHHLHRPVDVHEEGLVAGAEVVELGVPILGDENAVLRTRAVADETSLAVAALFGQRMWLSLTFDHRLVDGAPAARFLQYIKRLIEEPYLLLA